MFKRGWKYVVTVFRVYKTHVSGWLLAIVAIGLTIASAAVQNDPSRAAMVVRWAAWLTSGAAIWLVFVAQYDAWKQERDAKQVALDELDQEADMRGTIYIWPGQGGVRPEARIQFKCDCANYGRKTCQITKIFFDVDTEDRGLFRFELPLSVPSVKVVEHGIQYQESGHVYVPNTTVASFASATVDAGLIDSLGTQYKSGIKTVKKVPFSLTEVL
jgi:hypothetical protein